MFDVLVSRICTRLRIGAWLACCILTGAASAQPMRYPAVPLIVNDPFLSAWSMSDRLNGESVKHWTGKPFGMMGMLRVDGQTYRFMGEEQPGTVAAVQRSVEVNATQTIYKFACGPALLQLTFTSPLLIEDLEIAARPASYITFDVHTSDSLARDVAIYLDASAEWAVNKPDQVVQWNRVEVPGLHAMALGTTEQNVFGPGGDDTRIEWGQMLLAAPEAGNSAVIAQDSVARGAFAVSGALPAADDPAMPRAANDRRPVLALGFTLPGVTQQPARAHAIVAYDDQWSVEYFGERLRGWWRRNGAGPEQLLADAEDDYAGLLVRCTAFDTRVEKEAMALGGDSYARMCALVYRQAVAAHKIVASPKGEVLFFSKENFSGGFINTVDVSYPSVPLFLIYNPELAKGLVRGIFEYAESGKWNEPFAPHDLGSYPRANGQAYPLPMPIEESGNMILMTAGIVAAEGRIDFAQEHWPVLTRWADHLRQFGFDPAEQLCTDDFAGHLAHNANLSVKAIVALAAYGQMAGKLGETKTAEDYARLARELAVQWRQAANDGDHYRLAFDQPGTWSMKYNMVWDRLLGLGVFDPDIMQTELAYYFKVKETYGIPLDNRRVWTKSDWIFWIAAMTDSRSDFDAVIAPVYKYINETPARVPVSDWHDTTNAGQCSFQNRSVVGAYFMPILRERLKKQLENNK